MNTVLVWIDGDCSGHVVTCKSTSAGAVQLESHTIEMWSANQQVVSLSSAESEFYAIGSGYAPGLTVKHVLLDGLRRCAWHDSPTWLWSGETPADALLVASASVA